MTRILIKVVACLAIAGCARQEVHEPEAVPVARSSAEEVVLRLAEVPDNGLPGMASNGVPPKEQLRLDLYRRLMELGDNAVPALVRGLGNPDVRIRRNVILFLAAGQGYFPELHQFTRVRVPFSSLVGALKDSDPTVRGWTAQAIGWSGRDAVAAVPDLIALLADEAAGPRNSACIALREIGPAARDALPALRQALSDPNADVRGFAKQAIDTIEK